MSNFYLNFFNIFKRHFLQLNIKIKTYMEKTYVFLHMFLVSFKNIISSFIKDYLKKNVRIF